MNSIGGSVDLILDDASHDSKLTFESLKLLWPHLDGGGKGVYVIEDIGPMSELREHTTGEPFSLFPLWNFCAFRDVCSACLESQTPSAKI